MCNSFDAERRGMHSHAERGNETPCSRLFSLFSFPRSAWECLWRRSASRGTCTDIYLFLSYPFYHRLDQWRGSQHRYFFNLN
ncbi:hypothetical protein THIOM_000872 [Candidatus Thiomargarita nelsonii]|uniref:Uncharacterized protein n=1 Tax=Candidatus Thiomargarita nelsonii TaxID=1003181 RepID=A0A176S5C4_9GAMM|nr:hypothetical protein THIOM_000872 [Candidatus Thiomargarita nelsonii]